jgi:hypothetical protein
VSQTSADAVDDGRFERCEDLSMPFRLLLLLEAADPHGSLTPQSSAAAVLLLAEDAARPLLALVPQLSLTGVLGLLDERCRTPKGSVLAPLPKPLVPELVEEPQSLLDWFLPPPLEGLGQSRDMCPS